MEKVHGRSETDERWRLQITRDRPPAPLAPTPPLAAASQRASAHASGSKASEVAAEGGEGSYYSADWDSDSDSDEGDDAEDTVPSPHNGRRYVMEAPMCDVPGALSRIRANVKSAVHKGF